MEGKKHFALAHYSFQQPPWPVLFLQVSTLVFLSQTICIQFRADITTLITLRAVQGLGAAATIPAAVRVNYLLGPIVL